MSLYCLRTLFSNTSILLASFLVACSCGGEVDFSPYCNRVVEYLPAPGQFIGENFSARTMAEACDYAKSRLDQQYYVSLGAFGGYITVGFDHPVENRGGKEIAIKGNATEASSEPGVVWVMTDYNGNGCPDDIWYELRSEQYSAPTTRRSYAVTYFRPEPGSDVRWADNQGNGGYVRYLGAFHKQESYYPQWVSMSLYTLTGTCLAPRNYDASGDGSMWINPTYGWGYADDYTGMREGGWNLFNIDDAADYTGNPVHLDRIDFVKVQTAVQTSSGWLGEASTEVCAIADNNLLGIE